MHDYTFIQAPRPRVRKPFKWRTALGLVVVVAGATILTTQLLAPADAHAEMAPAARPVAESTRVAE